MLLAPSRSVPPGSPLSAVSRHNGFGVAQEQTPCCSQTYLVTAPVEERRPELVFQFLNVFGYGGLRHEQFSRCFGEAEPFSNGIENGQAKVQHNLLSVEQAIEPVNETQAKVGVVVEVSSSDSGSHWSAWFLLPSQPSMD